MHLGHVRPLEKSGFKTYLCAQPACGLGRIWLVKHIDVLSPRAASRATRLGQLAYALDPRADPGDSANETYMWPLGGRQMNQARKPAYTLCPRVTSMKPTSNNYFRAWPMHGLRKKPGLKTDLHARPVCGLRNLS